MFCSHPVVIIYFAQVLAYGKLLVTGVVCVIFTNALMKIYVLVRLDVGNRVQTLKGSEGFRDVLVLMF